jgi:predicted nucleic acid-binding protein
MAETFVLDASVALAWFIERSEDQGCYADSVLNLIHEAETVCIVPSVWHYETAAVLLRTHRDKNARFGKAKLMKALEALERLSIETHHQAIETAAVVNLGLNYHLQGYDALYFDLAKVNGVPIATFDRGILTACKRFNVERLSV